MTDIDWDEINGILEKVEPGMNTLSYEERKKGCVCLGYLSSEEKEKIAFLVDEVCRVFWQLGYPVGTHDSICIYLAKVYPKLSELGRSIIAAHFNYITM